MEATASTLWLYSIRLMSEIYVLLKLHTRCVPAQKEYPKQLGILGDFYFGGGNI